MIPGEFIGKLVALSPHPLSLAGSADTISSGGVSAEPAREKSLCSTLVILAGHGPQTREKEEISVWKGD